MIMEKEVTIGGAAASGPEALPVFQKLGIDFCCGGKKPLADALAEKQVSMKQFAGLLDAERADRGSPNKGMGFAAMSPAARRRCGAQNFRRSRTTG